MRRPKFAKGIRTQETRTSGGRADWSRKWFAALERIDLGGRFGRGRNYAMSGQVVEVKMECQKGERLVVAKVQGARDGAYEVTIDFRVPPEPVRGRIAAAIRREPMLVARLLAGEMPMEVEEIFRSEGYDLYPGARLGDAGKGGRKYDTVTACTCPDYANPCKHVFAAMIVLGEEVARRPSLLVELRGITMEELV